MTFRHFAALMLAALLTACSSGLDRRYLDANLGQGLELPPDLLAEEAESSFELPGSFSGDDPGQRKRVPVLAKVESMSLEGSPGLYWLTVEEPVDNLYQQVKNFWASEGYRLVVDEPVIGVMQTEWIYKEEGRDKGSGNWFTNLFTGDDLSASQDQFRTRIERGKDGRNRIYIAHRGTEYRHVIRRNTEAQTVTSQTRNNNSADDNQWRFRLPEPELEIEMLSRLMVYLGLEREQVEAQATAARLFKPRALLRFDSEENSPYLILKDPYHIAWNRVYHNLERMNFEIASAEFESGLGLVREGVIVVNAEVSKPREKGGFFSFLKTEERSGRQFVLVLSEEGHELTRVNIETEKGEFDTTPEGAEFLSLLHRRVQ